MLFDSPEFAVFFVLFVGAYFSLGHRGQNLLLVAGSYIFYGWWDWRFCGLLALSTVIDWACGIKIRSSRPKLWVTLSIVSQIGILAFFKYFNFFEENLRTLLKAAGVQVHWGTLEIILPVGISFYTFQTLSYTIDIYRKKIEPVRNILDFAVFVSFWPHLVAGPILRASYLIPQIMAPRKVSTKDWAEGTYFIIVGLIKKVAVADVIAAAIEPCFKDPSQFSAWQLVLAAHLFTLRIYGDFSGYSDIARGTSLFLGFRLTENFDHPYFSTSITEFWRRWHISLSSWLRDYLYFPLGGNRRGRLRTYINLMTVMLLGGLWHGADWNYVFWGLVNGLLLAGERLWAERSEAQGLAGQLPAATEPPPLSGWRRVLAHLYTFELVNFTMLVFAITNFSTLGKYLARVAGCSFVWDAERLRQLVYAVIILLIIDLPEHLFGERTYLTKLPRPVRVAFYTFALTLLAITWTRNYEPFIYFQF